MPKLNRERVPSPWLLPVEAAALMHVSRFQLKHLAAAGLFTTRQLPGCQVQYDRASVERVAAAYIKEAVAV